MAHVQIRPDGREAIQIMIDGADWSGRAFRDGLELVMVGEDGFRWPALAITFAVGDLREGFSIKPIWDRRNEVISLFRGAFEIRIDGADIGPLGTDFSFVAVPWPGGDWSELGLRVLIEVDPLDIGDDLDVFHGGVTDEAFERAQRALETILRESEAA